MLAVKLNTVVPKFNRPLAPPEVILSFQKLGLRASKNWKRRVFAKPSSFYEAQNLLNASSEKSSSRAF